MQTIENKIRPLESGDYPEFFAYLNSQLEINGKQGYTLFQPVSRDVVDFPADKESTFIAGLGKNMDESGWRRAWVICNRDGAIMGHVDLRAHADRNITHRALLGMGVGKAYRGKGLSRQLLALVCEWVSSNDQIEWIDIEVLSANLPALALYRSAGFEQLSEIPDMYRIDGNPEAVIRMARKFAASG